MVLLAVSYMSKLSSDSLNLLLTARKMTDLVARPRLGLALKWLVDVCAVLAWTRLVIESHLDFKKKCIL